MVETMRHLLMTDDGEIEIDARAGRYIQGLLAQIEKLQHQLDRLEFPWLDNPMK